MTRWQVFHRLCRRLHASDGGFTMVEVMVSLAIIAIIASAGAAFFIGSIRGINGEKQRQIAAQVANQDMEQIQSLPPNKLTSGRTKAQDQVYWASAAATRLGLSTQDDETNSADWDATAASDPLVVPYTATTTSNAVQYTQYNFVDVCWMNTTTGACGPTQAAGLDQEYRVSIDVYWTSVAPCATGCDYSTSTLIDPSSDPTFNSNITDPTWHGAANAPSPSSLSNFNEADSCTTGSGTFSGDEVKILADNMKQGITARIAAKGGTLNTSSIYLNGASEIDFCITTLDQPGSYTVSLINPDGGHLQTSLTEAPIIRSVSYNNSTGTETLSGGGFETGLSLAAPGTPWTGVGAPNQGTYPTNTVDTLPVGGFTGPTNGAALTLTLTNPDATTATFTITAPKVTTASVVGVAGQTLTKAITGTGFQSGMTVKSQTGSCNASVATVTSATAGSLQLSPTAGSAGTTCVITLVNPDGGTATVNATIDAPPAITAAPTFISGVSGAITGTGFVSGMTAAISGTNCSSVSLGTVTATSATITPTISSTTNTTCTLLVTNPDGGTASKTITVDAPPNITSYVIKSGATTQTSLTHSKSYTWTVTGTGFQTGATVSVTENGVALAAPTAVTITATQITFTLSTNANTSGTSSWPFIVKVTNPDTGVDTQSNSYKVS